MNRCELKNWIDETISEANSRPETFETKKTSIVCSECGQQVRACVKMSASGEIIVSSDSCQGDNPSAIQAPHHESRTISNKWLNLIFGSLPHWLNPKYNPSAENTNTFRRIESECDIMWKNEDMRNSGGKQG